MLLYKPHSLRKQRSTSVLYISSDKPIWFSFIRPSFVDVQFVDFDGVRFHISSVEKKTALSLSMSIRCWDELVAYGASEILHREYGRYLSDTVEPQYNVTLNIDLEQLPQDGGTSSGHWCSIRLLYDNPIIRGAGGTDKVDCSDQAQCPCSTLWKSF